MLYQLLKHVVDTSSYATPQNIDKALCFIDSYSSVNKSVQRFRQQLVNMTKDIVDTTKKYTINSANGSYNVYNIVSFYTSYVANADQDKRYAEFKKLSIASVIRILFGTLAVAIGTNFPNIKYIIQLRNAITKDINNIIQRLGRTGRSLLAGKQVYTVLYLLQYLDDRERNIPANSNYQSIVPRTSTDYNIISDYLPSNTVVRALARLNRLRYVETLGNKFNSDRNGMIDLEEQFKDNIEAAIDSLNLTKKRDQTKAQIAARNNSPKIIRKLQYAVYYLVRAKKMCFRTMLYKQYSEALLRYLAQRIVLGIADYCSQYNLALLYRIAVDLDNMLALLKQPTSPRVGSRQQYIVEELEAQFGIRTTKHFKDPLGNLRYSILRNVILNNKLLQSICSALEYNSLRLDSYGQINVPEFKEAAPLFTDQYTQGGKDREKLIPIRKLTEFIATIATRANKNYEDRLAAARNKRYRGNEVKGNTTEE